MLQDVASVRMIIYALALVLVRFSTADFEMKSVYQFL